ncbi:hypothetical protein PFICI_00815 [Pestalotiopsis fici W106-1]|uniref:Mid2 domain-containing protein n=1 Tax=Pestalotiopsis fici (strain W106-1 / CGMCC3.15140) TaxID=1229662 RepID=W3XN90_PESFW|nr:uncharacterized protein PFICI_00815 [Pestalotiopsis fici W106-1]ETS86987.1 hypothetical protein PFICI_00815 [Pestalotiopsis fici W106-1]
MAFVNSLGRCIVILTLLVLQCHSQTVTASARFMGWYEPPSSDPQEMNCGTDQKWTTSGKYGVCCNTAKTSCQFQTACSSTWALADSGGTDIACTGTSTCYSMMVVYPTGSAIYNYFCGQGSWPAATVFRQLDATTTTTSSKSSSTSSTTSASTGVQSLTTATSTTPMTSTGTSIISSPTSSEPATTSAGPSTGTIAGAVVGSIVGVAIVGALLWFLLRRKKGGNGGSHAPGEMAATHPYQSPVRESVAKVEHAGSPELYQHPVAYSDSPQVYEMGGQVHEMGGNVHDVGGNVHEMGGGQAPHYYEMDASTYHGR